MDRVITQSLQEWSRQEAPMPIILRGARQVGKSHLLNTLAYESFEDRVCLNLETRLDYLQCFERLEPKTILSQLEALEGKRVIPGKTLLFLDEIQACPRAIMALRYFREQMPELHVCSAGSLLEFSLSEAGFSMPVGRVQYQYLQPMSFIEFLMALGKDALVEMIEAASLSTSFAPVIHDELNKLIKQYLLVGGMPDVVKSFVETQSYVECHRRQQGILSTYIDDFAKYAPTGQHKYLQSVIQRAPALAGQVCKYSHINPDYRSQDVSRALNNLMKAGVITKIPAVTASGVPLKATASEKKFKILFLDVGLMTAATGLSNELLQSEDFHAINKGAIMEQFVGQELLAYQSSYVPRELFFWTREKAGSMAEIDYVLQHGSHILPLEVKAGKTGRLKSLQVFKQEKKSKIGITVNTEPLNFSEGRLNIPAYLLSRVDALLGEVL